MVLLQAVVDEGHVRVRRVREDSLSLHIAPDELLVVVLRKDGGGVSNCGALFRVELLEALPVVVLDETDIVHVVMEVRVRLDALVEPGEGVIHVSLFLDAAQQGVETDLETGVELG